MTTDDPQNRAAGSPQNADPRADGPQGSDRPESRERGALEIPAEPIREPEVLEVPSVLLAAVRVTGWPVASMVEFMDGVYSHLPAALAEAGVEITGPAVAYYTSMPAETVDLAAGFPVDRELEAPIELASGLTATTDELPAGRVARATHIGPYDALTEAWGRFIGAVVERGEQVRLPFWEVYVSDPLTTDPSATRTDMVTAIE